MPAPRQGRPAPYNWRMPAAARPLSHLPRLLAALCGLAAAAALAQAPAKPPRDATAPPPKGTEQAIERIQHEDTGSRIDELRVGGETKHITVQPRATRRPTPSPRRATTATRPTASANAAARAAGKFLVSDSWQFSPKSHSMRPAPSCKA